MSLMIKRRVGRLLLYIGIIFGAVGCVDDVDFSAAYEKTVVVECFLNNQSDTQTLRMYYNGSGETISFEPLPENVTVELFKNGSNIGSFTRTNDFDWTINLPLALNVNDYYDGPSCRRTLSWDDMQFKLIVNIGNKTMTAYTNLAAGSVIASGRTLFTSITSSNINVWLCNTDSEDKLFSPWSIDPGKTFFGTIATYSYDTSDSSFDSFNRISDHTYYFAARSISKYITIDNTPGINNMLIVSEEYDKYLKTFITKIVEEDPNNPAKQFNEYKVFSNIEGGVGTFALYFNYRYLLNPPEYM